MLNLFISICKKCKKIFLTSKEKGYIIKYDLNRFNKTLKRVVNMKKATIYDIARICGCSPATVSLALNNNSRVSKITKAKVTEVSEKLNYQASYFGKSLVTGKANTIGFFVPDMHNQVFLSMINGVEMQLKGSDYHLLLDVTRNDKQKELDCINTLLEHKVDGLIISPLYPKELIEHILKNKVDVNRVVFIGVSASAESGIHFVETDSFTGAYEGVTHMLKKGRRKIAFLAPIASKEQGIRRLCGYKKALEDFGIPFDEELIFKCDQKFENIYNLTKSEISRHNPDGIFCLYDMSAIPAMRAATDLGIKIPDDLSVVGYDNIEIGQYIDHSLTTIETYQIRQGGIAAQMLIDLLAGKKIEKKNIVEPSLVVRESS